MSAALDAARASGLIRAGEPLLVMLSGGADSACLLDVGVKLDARVCALHLNYGLRRDESDGDEAHCRALCRQLGVPLVVERPVLGAGNLQALARDARYDAAERHAAGDYAAAHTRSDQAETVLYRLTSSPGRRALLGMAPRRGRLVRPLLEVGREDTRAHCRGAGLRWREDSLNAERRFARARIRHDALPALGHRAEAAIAETARQLREEAELLDAVVHEALTDDLAAIAALPPALAREVLRRLAGAPLARERVEAILTLAGRGGSASVDVAGGLRALVEYGRVRFTRSPVEPEAPAEVTLAIPGSARFGAWDLRASRPADVTDGVTLEGSALGSAVTVRSWQPGDRMRPVGLRGSKKLQDIFSDRKVPRARRRTLPVLVAGGEIAWIPGVAVDERFVARDCSTAAVGLSAVRRSG